MCKCVYCNGEVTRRDREGVCSSCKDINDEQIENDGDDYVTCEDCRREISNDDAYYVNDSYYCGECVSRCNICDSTVHNDDISSCDDCGCNICEDCLIVCDKCGGVYCESCIKHKDGKHYCKDCYKEIEDVEQEKQEVKA